MKKKTLITAGFLLLLPLSSSLLAQSIGWTPWCRWNYFAAGVNMTQEQLDQFGNLQQAFLEKTATLQTELASKSLEYRTILTNPTSDETAILNLQKDIFALEQRYNEEALAYRLKARKIFTTEQLALLPPGYSFGFGFGMGMGYGRGVGMGMGMGMGQGWGGGRGRGMGRGYGRGWGVGPGSAAGWGRGYPNNYGTGIYPRRWR